MDSIDLWQIIFEFAPFLAQIRLTCVCRYFHEKLRMEDFLNIPNEYLALLSDPILRSYAHITQLDASYNPQITDINHLTRLEGLVATGNCGIGDAGLSNLNLLALDISDNPKVTNLNHMTKLRILGAKGFFYGDGIGDDGIKNLNLRELHLTNNVRIASIGHMTNLEILNANHCIITDVDISTLNLVELYAHNNMLITNLNHMTKLKILDASGPKCGITKEGIKDLKLEKVFSYWNPKITGPAFTLEFLPLHR